MYRLKKKKIFLTLCMASIAIFSCENKLSMNSADALVLLR